MLSTCGLHNELISVNGNFVPCNHPIDWQQVIDTSAAGERNFNSTADCPFLLRTGRGVIAYFRLRIKAAKDARGNFGKVRVQDDNGFGLFVDCYATQPGAPPFSFPFFALQSRLATN